MPSATGGSQAERPSVSERRIIGVELRDLTQLETEALLDRDVSACLAFVDGAGFPRQVPCWFLWDGEAFYVTSVAEKFHVKRLQAEKDRPQGDIIWGINRALLESNKAYFAPYKTKDAEAVPAQ